MNGLYVNGCNFRFNPNWLREQQEGQKCAICGNGKSVKYLVLYQGTGTVQEKPVCNRCVLKVGGDKPYKG